MGFKEIAVFCELTLLGAYKNWAWFLKVKYLPPNLELPKHDFYNIVCLSNKRNRKYIFLNNKYNSPILGTWRYVSSQNTAISLNKTKLILYPQVRNSLTKLTLTYVLV